MEQNENTELYDKIVQTFEELSQVLEKDKFLITRIALGIQLKDLRTEKGISIYKLSKQTGISRQQIANIESGNSNYTINSLLNYCDSIGFQITLKEFSK